MTRLQARPGRGWPLALGIAWTAVLYGALALPGRILATRDLPFLHLPLRTDFARLLSGGLPRWDPWLHGGQPVLSNPHYAPWYPATWLVTLLPPYLALQWALLLHAGLAFAGAWRLARHWGTGSVGAAFAAVAYAGGGFFAGSTGLPLIFFGMAWWPWAVAAADQLGDAPREARTRPAIALALVLALQILNGDPASVVASGLAILILALATRRGFAVRSRRFACAMLLALALAGVQVVPTLFRVRDSARAHGIEDRQASVWSTQPARLGEAFFPHLFGDPNRDEEDLYFGWRFYDRAYPLLLSIYPGLLVSLLGLSALLRGGIRGRGVLAAGVAVGVLFGIGRHDPLWPLLLRAVPFLSSVRYPEKFLLLAAACLVFAAALETEHLLASRADRRSFVVPAALAGLVFISAAIVVLLFSLSPGVAANFVRANSGVPPTPGSLVAGVTYLRTEALTSLGVVTLALGVLFALYRAPRRGAAFLAIALLALDLWRVDRNASPTMALDAFRTAAPLAGEVPEGSRLFYEGDLDPAPPVGLRVGLPGERQLRARLGRLEPLSAPLRGRREVLERDFDLLLTGWGRWGREVLRREWPHPENAKHILEAWNVAARVRPRPVADQLADLRGGDASPAPAEIVRVERPLPEVRSVVEADFHAEPEAAFAGARGQGFDMGRREQLVGEPTARRYAPVEIADAQDLGDRWTIRLQEPAAMPALLVLAVTFDDGWSATADGREAPIWPTALGQIAVEVAAGASGLELAYRDPWVGVGAALSLVALLMVLLLVRRPALLDG